MIKSVTDDFTNSCKVACEHGFVFISEKCAVKQPFVTFFRCVHDKDGAHPDPAKVSTMHAIPAPKFPTQLQELLSMAMYLSQFVFSLSSFTAPLLELLN